MPDTTITASQIISDFGSFYLDRGQNENSLRMRPYEKFGTLEALTIMPTNDTVLEMSDVQVGEVLQAYQDAFTPKGAVVFKPIQIFLRPIKIDQQFNPTKLVNTWLGFLTNNNVDRTTWPFIRWMIEKYLIEQEKEDLEMKAIYNGSYLAPTAGTAGNAINVMDGIKKQINAGVTATSITPIATGAPSTTPATWCGQVEAFVKSIPEKYWYVNMELNMSRALAQRYREGKRVKYNMSYAQETDLETVVDYTNIRIKGRASMTGSNKIWMTPKENYVAGVKGYSNMEMFEIEKIDRNVKIYTDWWMGVGFLLGDLVFTNDQELPV